MMKLFVLFKISILLIACGLLSACLGGTVAQQIARSIATSIADKTVARAMDVDEDSPRSKPDYQAKSEDNIQTKSPFAYQAKVPTPSQQLNARVPTLENLQKSAANSPAISEEELEEFRYKMAFASAGFNTIQPIAEPLPIQAVEEPETPIQVLQASPLVRVQLFNLLIGEEKIALLEKARLQGAASVPEKRYWNHWQVATGILEGEKKHITFLIPPEFGKLSSGTVTMVELAGPGELNIARYKAN